MRKGPRFSRFLLRYKITQVSPLSYELAQNLTIAFPCLDEIESHLKIEEKKACRLVCKDLEFILDEDFLFSPAFGLIRLPLPFVSDVVAREPIDIETSKFTRMLLIPRRFAD
jgi:hypothetical protein